MYLWLGMTSLWYIRYDIGVQSTVNKPALALPDCPTYICTYITLYILVPTYLVGIYLGCIHKHPRLNR